MTLISSPSKAWSEIKVSDGRNRVMTDFVYPMIGLCSLSVFIGVLIESKAEVSLVQEAMSKCCAIAVSLFGGYFLAAYLVDIVGQKYLNRPSQFELCCQLVGYSMAIPFVLNIIYGIFPIKLLFWLLQLYVLFVVFEGARSLMNVNREKITNYTVITSCIVLFCPAIISWIFNKLTVILN